MIRTKKSRKARNAVVLNKRAAAFLICGAENGKTDCLLSNSISLEINLNAIAALRKCGKLFFTEEAAPNNGAASFSHSTKNKRFHRKNAIHFVMTRSSRGSFAYGTGIRNGAFALCADRSTTSAHPYSPRAPPVSEIKGFIPISEKQEVRSMAEKQIYYIKIPGSLVEVTEEVYIEYFRMRRRWFAQGERDTYNGVISYDAMDTDETLGEEMIPDSDSSSVEDAALDKLLREKLHRCLAQLPKSEQDMLHTLYFEELSERQVANKLGLHYMTLHSRKVSILRKLRKMMES